MADNLKPGGVPEMPANWQRFIRRDLPLAVAVVLALSLCVVLNWYRQSVREIIELQDARIEDQKQNANQYARMLVGLAERGLSARDLANAGGDSSLQSDINADRKADSN